MRETEIYGCDNESQELHLGLPCGQQRPRVPVSRQLARRERLNSIPGATVRAFLSILDVGGA